MRRPVFLLAGIFLALAFVILITLSFAETDSLSPFPSPDSPDPAGTMALRMLAERRGIPFILESHLPLEERERLLWFVNSPKIYSPDELDEVRDWVARGGHLVLVFSESGFNFSFAQISPFLDDLGFNLMPSLLEEPAAAKMLPFRRVTLRPASFFIRNVRGIRIKGQNLSGSPCWIEGSWGNGTWEAVADSFAFENTGLAEGGNAYFALAMLGDGVSLDTRLFGIFAGERHTLGDEPLFWAVFLQALLLGGLLLLNFQRAAPPLEPPKPAGTVRMRSCLSQTLAERKAFDELVYIETSYGTWDPEQRRAVTSLATDERWREAYRILRERERVTRISQ